MTRWFHACLALVLASCGTRVQTEVLVVVVPVGFATTTDAGLRADAGAEPLGSVVVEARAIDSTPVCASRSSAPTSAAIAVDALHDVESVYTLGVVSEDGADTRITIWGKVGGLDRARRSFVVHPSASTQRVLCVALAPDAFDCQCADLASAIEIHDGQGGVASAIDACIAAIRAGSIPGAGPRTTCSAFDPASCPGAAHAVHDPACETVDGSTPDGGPADAAPRDASPLDAGSTDTGALDGETTG